MAGAYRLLSGGDIDAGLRQRCGLKNEDEGYNVLATLLPLSIFREFFSFLSPRKSLSVVANFFFSLNGGGEKLTKPSQSTAWGL